MYVCCVSGWQCVGCRIWSGLVAREGAEPYFAQKPHPQNIARKASVVTVPINTPTSLKFNISLITKLRKVFPFRSWCIVLYYIILYYIIVITQLSNTLFISGHYKHLSVHQTTICIPNNCQCTKQLSVYQTTVSVRNNCQYTKQLSVYQTIVSVPNNC
jgi:hypothetical protein